MHKGKRMAVMAMTFALTATGIGLNNGSISFCKDTAITASAETEQLIEVNARKYGFSDYASSIIDKIIIRNGDIVIKELDFETFFNEGYTLNGNMDTTVEFYDERYDGIHSTVYNAVTGKLISYTGELIEGSNTYIPVDLLLEYPDEAVFYVYNSLCSNYAFGNYFLSIPKCFDRQKLLSEYKEKGKEYVAVNIPYGQKDDNEVFIGIKIGEVKNTTPPMELRKYNSFTMEFEGESLITPAISQGNAEKMQVFSTRGIRETMPDCNSVEITIDEDDTTKFISADLEVGTLTNDDKTLVLTAEDLKKFSLFRNIYFYTTIRNPIPNFCTIKANYDNGYEEYIGFADCFYKINDTRRLSPVIDKKGNIVKDNFGDYVYPATYDNGEGKGIVSIKTLDFFDEERGTIGIFCEDSLIDSVHLKEYISDGYEIEDFNPDKDYYIRGILDNCNGNSEDNDVLWYKYNPSLNAWIKTVDTRKQIEYEIKVDCLNFPEAIQYTNNGGIVNILGTDTTVYEIANGEINKGNTTFVIDGRKQYQVDIVKVNDSFRDYFYHYELFGVNVEYELGKAGVKPLTIKNIDGENHFYTVDGTFEENGLTFNSGRKIQLEFADDGENVKLKLFEGKYDITRDDGSTAHIIIDEDDSQKIKGSIGKDGTYNSDSEDGLHKKGEKVETLFGNESESVYNFLIVKSPDGKELYKGNVTAEGIDSVKEIIGTDVLAKYPYLEYEEKSSENNSTRTGFLTLDKSGNFAKKSIEKGDINSDGKIGVSDLVIAQKYLLNGLDSGTVFTIDNLIAMDMCKDGRGDVFDMVELRKAVLKNS